MRTGQSRPNAVLAPVRKHDAPPFRRKSATRGNVGKDLANLNDAQNRVTWQPFHFLPGNGGLPAGDSPSVWFIEKLVCTPDSHVAREMLASCINDHEAPYALHRLGITMHVYADTHQGFAGIQNTINRVNSITRVSDERVLPGGIEGFGTRLLREAIPPVGHGCALTLPDLPFLTWEYKNGYDQPIQRDNTALFLAAADALCRAMQAYRATHPAASTVPINPADAATIKDLFTTTTSVDPLPRHQAWLQALQAAALALILQMGEEERAPHLAILDLNLPKHDGLEILEKIRATRSLTTLPIVILSSSSSPRDRARIERFGVGRYLVKPPSLDEFLRIGLVVKELLSESL